MKAKTIKKRGSIFSMLLSNYILFSLVLLISIIIIVGIYFFRMIGIIVEVDVTQIKQYDEILQNSEYDRFPTERLLGSDGFIIVLDNNQSPIYKTGFIDGLDKLKKEDIEFIPNYINSPMISVETLEKPNKGKHTTITIKEQEKVNQYILNEEKEFIYQSTPFAQNKLTNTQFKLLTDTYSSEYTIEKYPFVSNSGEEYTLLLATNRNNIITNIGQTWGSFFTFIGITYGILLLLFILWLKRRIKKPLNILEEKINDFEKNKIIETQYQYKGPREFVDIFEHFNIMTERLNKSEEDKKRMIADISHDLKTPITVINGYTKALSDGIVSKEEQIKYLKIINKKAKDLSELVNDFYEYNKLEHPDYSYNFSNEDICEYLRIYIADRYDSLEINKISADVNIPEEKIICRIDKKQLKRAFDNIINNALKYNKKDITLLFELKKKNESVKILIGDNGIGIPKEIKDLIFEPFVVGEKSRNTTGSGLGLSITKKIIEAHNGKINLLQETEEYKTIYEIHLPIIKNLLSN